MTFNLAKTEKNVRNNKIHTNTIRKIVEMYLSGVNIHDTLEKMEEVIQAKNRL